ncbi:UNVERIFIED_ORG: hypothetical protein FHW05_002342 [Pantoea agglomerans]
MKIDNFEEAKSTSEQLNVLIQIINRAKLSDHENDVLTGLALNLSCELHWFCEDGLKKELANDKHP